MSTEPLQAASSDQCGGCSGLISSLVCGIVVLCVLVCSGGSIWFRWCSSWFRLRCPKFGRVRRSSVVYSASWCQCVM